MRQRLGNLLVASVAALLLSLPGMQAQASITERYLAAGESWAVAETVRLDRLVIAEGATLEAPGGRSLTLTVNGIETGIGPGTFEGDIVLTVTDEIPIQHEKLSEPHMFRTAVYIENGNRVPEKSVAAAVTAGTVTDTAAKDLKITSVGENFNGVLVTGDTPFTYAVIRPDIDFSGNGGNDFSGFGAAIMSSGKADVTVTEAKIITRGAVRSAVWAGGKSTIRVDNSHIEAYDGVLPEDYSFSVDPGKMKEVPWVLGITGNCRATNVVGGAAAYYTDTYIRAQAWGALSTDGTRNGKLHVTDCTIEVMESGYGAYADGVVEDVFRGCRFDVPDYGLIMTGGEGVFTDGSVVNSGRFGVMFHGSANLTIDGGSVFNTGEAVLQIKSAFPHIVADGAVLNSKNGILIQSMLNDDPIKAAMPGGGIPGRGGAGEMPAEMPMDMPMSAASANTDISATFRNMALEGDIIHTMTSLGDMIVSLEKTTLSGAITTATGKSKAAVDGVTMTPETAGYIGAVENTFGPSGESFGLKVSLDGASTWIVDETSYLTGLVIADGAVVSAPAGCRLILMVDGKKTPLSPGRLEGPLSSRLRRRAEVAR